MKNKLHLSLVLVLFVGNCWGQVMFQRVISAPFGCSANAVEQTTDGGYIIAGTMSGKYSSDSVAYLIKTNQEGDTVWTKTFKANAGSASYSVQQTSDGGYIIVGLIDNYTLDEDLYLIKTNADGDTVWTRVYGGVNDDAGYFVQQTNDSGYIITGSTASFGAGSDDVYLLKTNANGDIVWTRTYGGSFGDAGYCVKQTSDNGYIICGYTTNFGAVTGDVYLIKTDANGDSLWTKIYGGTHDDVGNAVLQTSDHGYIITGYTASFGGDGQSIYLIKTNINGDTLWTKFFTEKLDNSGTDIKQTSDGGYIITGNTTSNRYFNDNVYLIKTNSLGDTIWTRNFGGTGVNYGNSVQQTTDGGYVVAGNTNSFGSSQTNSGIYLIKTDANGNSGCYQDNTNTIVGYAPMQVSSTNTFVDSGGTASPTNTIVGSGGTDSTLCLVNGINELTNSNSISIYPNPASNELTIKSAAFRIKNITIYNVLGQEVQGNQYSIINDQYSINISSLVSDLYFVRVAGQKESWVGNFVKE